MFNYFRDMADKNIFDLEYQYQLYLKRVGMKEIDMHPQQRKQLKETFYGATGQFLMLLKEELAELEEAEGIETLQKMTNQVADFFLKVSSREN